MRPAGSATVSRLTVALMAVILLPIHAWAQVGTARGRGAGPGVPTQTGRPRPVGPPTVVLGRVVDGDTGEPVGGAIVQIGRNRPSASPIAMLAGVTPPAARPGAETEGPTVVIADAEGRFVLRDVPVGGHPLTAELPGYVNASHGQTVPRGPSRPFSVTGNVPVQEVTLRMWRFAAISGVVRDDAGDPAVGVRVEAVEVRYLGGRRTLRRAGNAETDDRGHYRLASLVPGEYLVAVPSSTQSVAVSTAEDFTEARATTAEAPLEYLDDLRASGAPTPTTTGLRVGDQVVRVSGTAAPLAPSVGADGRLSVFPRRYHPAAASPAEATTLRIDAGEEREGVDLDLTLDPAFSIEGRLVDETGAPVANIGVRLLRNGAGAFTSDTGQETSATSTDQDGRFRLLGVPPGDYAIKVLRVPRGQTITQRISTSGGTSTLMMSGSFSGAAPSANIPDEPTLWAELPVAIGDRDVADVTLVLTEGASLSGRLEFEGGGTPPSPEQIERARVTLDPIDGQRVTGIRPVTVAPDGTFTTMGYPPGRYFVSTTAAGAWRPTSVDIAGVNAMDRPITIGSRDLANVVIRMSGQPTRVTVTVQAPAGAESGEVASQVVAFPADFLQRGEDGIPPSRLGFSGFTPNGQHVLVGLLAGDYLLVAVESADQVDFGNPAVLSQLSRSATLVSLAPGGQQTVSLPLTRLPGGLR